MELIVLIILMGLSFGAGYGFRGLIGREIKKVSAVLVAEIARVEASVKAEVAKVENSVKAEVSKF